MDQPFHSRCNAALRSLSRVRDCGRAGGEAESEAVVDTYVHYLRRKLGHGIVATVHGRGYQLGRD